MYKFTLDGLTPVKAEPYPFTDLQRAWIDELRSGKYEQGQGFLKDKHDRYCCLGILCELAGLTPRLAPEARAYAWHEGESTLAYFSTGFLPSRVRIQAGLYGDLGQFTRAVKFKGVPYGTPAIGGFLQGHGSLGSMNDNRIIPTPGGVRPFSFKEIADYIEHDPWNVFQPPEDIAKNAVAIFPAATNAA